MTFEEAKEQLKASPASIRRTFFGGSEDVNFHGFASIAIQAWDVAEDIATGMLESGEEYEYNAEEPEFREVFEIINEDALRADVELSKASE